MHVHVRRRVQGVQRLYEKRSGEKNCEKQRYSLARRVEVRGGEKSLLRSSTMSCCALFSDSSQAFNSAQCLVSLTIIALRRSVSLSSYSRSSLRLPAIARFVCGRRPQTSKPSQFR